ncbi:ATP-binding protein [Leptothoe sp. LEGE 181152]|nr:ATP-binding protein [Leptothoe sp. LEGE 181152]
MDTKHLTVELSEQALKNLVAYCEQSGLDSSTVIQSYLLTLGAPQSNLSKEPTVTSEDQQSEHNPLTQLQKIISELEREKIDLEILLDTTLEHSDYITHQLRIAKVTAELANQSKSRFLARMSHELRTPLNAILGFSQLLENTPSLSSQQREQLTIINRSGEHLLTLINDILDMSKLEAGKTIVNPSIINLHTLLQAMQAMFKLKADAKGLELILNYSPELPQYVETDAGKLKQVLINLLDNAIKFTERGQVCLRVSFEALAAEQQGETSSRTPCTLYCEVEDSGPGIAESDLEVIFTPFEQTSVGRNIHQGTGLGLSISRQFIQLMGGQLTVNSRVGVGSKFELHIPVYQYSDEMMSVEIPAELSVASAIEHLSKLDGQERQIQIKENNINKIESLSPSTAASLDEMLNDMPPQWLKELHYAASQLKGKQVMQLIQQVSEEKAALAHHLRELAENYQFNKITEMTMR